MTGTVFKDAGLWYGWIMAQAASGEKDLPTLVNKAMKAIVHWPHFS